MNRPSPLSPADDSDLRPTTFNRVVHTLGAPWMVGGLAILVAAGVATALILGVRASLDDARRADMSAETAEITAAAVQMLAVLQTERGLAEMYVASGDPEHLARYLQAADETDDTMASLGAATERVTTALTSLGEIRAAVVDHSGAGSVLDLYGQLIEPIFGRLAEFTSATSDAQGVRSRRAVLSILEAAEATGRRRALIVRILGRESAPTDEEQIRLDLLERDIQLKLSTAALLLDGDLRERVRGLASLEPHALPPSGTDPVAWFFDTGLRLSSTVDVALDVNTALLERAELSAARADQGLIRTTVLLGGLFLLTLLAGGSALVASRGRANALEEYANLVHGLRRWFFADALPDVTGVDIQASYVPSATHAGAGGDFYDAFVIDEDTLALVVGDVVGHGPEAVAHMAEVKNVLRGQAASRGLSPAGQLALLDRTVTRSGIMATLLYAHLDMKESVVTFSRAGHMPAILRPPDRPPMLLEFGADVPVGVTPEESRSDTQVSLPPGSLLILYTDGLVEAPGVDLDEAIDSLVEIVAAHDGALDELAARMIENRPVLSRTDDAALLIVRWMGRSDGGLNEALRREALPFDAAALEEVP